MLEAEVWTPEEYDLLVGVGWQRFLNEHLVFRVSDMKTPEEVAELGTAWMVFLARFIEEVEKRGAIPYGIMPNVHPFFWMSLTRSMVKFTEDLYYRPEVVERAMKVVVPEWTRFAIDCARG